MPIAKKWDGNRGIETLGIFDPAAPAC